MTPLFERLLGRTPIGWLQLTHKPMRLLAALTGVAFANILVFMQLGFMGSMSEGAVRVYRALDANVAVSATDMNTLSDASNVPRSVVLQTLAWPEVTEAIPLYIGRVDWEQPGETTMALMVFGSDPDAHLFRGTAAHGDELALLDNAVVDSLARKLAPHRVANLRESPVDFEFNGVTLRIVDSVAIGAGFETDGYLLVSDQTFFHVFQTRSPGAPNHVFLRLAAGARPEAVATRLQEEFGTTLLARTVDDARDADLSFQTTRRPTGIIFGFGVVIGILVGIVIVYQVLSTDVADHLSEYATFKAIGYRQRFFVSIVLEEAVILAVLGFVPGFTISMVLYKAARIATGLPIEMTLGRVFFVFGGTVAMCALSGILATRRLANADPAELF